ncbi:uncharacterized protein LOC100890685 [Strongylocentrotus purpuratus]|uniref:Uncharacterized protein n=1 Tax=Strongylocentrotus purpuratus TaxID=7668 RepID=A0A7M7LPG5_STRPU|nr:uncharacterized protein LOC100890685 [Strongylocentrotus purpuratus]
MGSTRIAAILSLSLAMYATVHYTEANPARSLDINSIFLGLCPRYIALLDTSGNPECTEEFIASIQYDLKDQTLATDIIVHLTLAEEGKLGLQTADPNVEGFEFDSACEILEHLCTPVIQIPDSARYRRSSSNSTSTSSSTSGSSSTSSETG